QPRGPGAGDSLGSDADGRGPHRRAGVPGPHGPRRAGARGDVAQGTGGRGAGLRRTGRGRLGGIWHCSGMIEEEDSNHRVTENTEKDTEEAERASGEKKRDLLCLTLSYFSVLFSVFSVTLWLALFLPDRIRDDLHLR